MFFDAEVVERGESADDGREGRRNLRIVGVGVVGFAVDDVLVNLGVEGVAHLGDGAGELERAFAGIDAFDAEAVIAEPGFDGGDVLIGGTELRSELSGREPLVIAGRCRAYVCCVMSWWRRGFLSRAALQDDLHPVELHSVGRDPAVVGGVGEGMDRMRKRDELRFVDWVDDAGGGCDLLRQGRNGSEGDAGQYAQGERAQIDHMEWSWTLSRKRTSTRQSEVRCDGRL